MTITKSAGNNAGKPPDDKACPYHLNAICVGATNHTPAMASYSSWVNPNPVEQSVRAMLAAAGRAADPDHTLSPSGWWYSTPAHGQDNHDGAGFPTADLLTCPESHPLHLDLTIGQPGPEGAPPPGGPPPQSLRIKPQNTGIAPGPSDGRLYFYLKSWWFPNGGRIRTSIHWDACSTNVLDPPPAPALPDFDLFLYDRDHSQYRYASQSNDDNNEGFDITIDPSVGGNYDVYVAWPSGATGCGGRTDTFVQFENIVWGAQ